MFQNDCPVCGAKHDNIIVESSGSWNTDDVNYAVSCLNCGFSITGYVLELDAINSWEYICQAEQLSRVKYLEKSACEFIENLE